MRVPSIVIDISIRESKLYYNDERLSRNLQFMSIGGHSAYCMLRGAESHSYETAVVSTRNYIFN
jgi:hypothetical protein